MERSISSGDCTIIPKAYLALSNAENKLRNCNSWWWILHLDCTRSAPFTYLIRVPLGVFSIHAIRAGIMPSFWARLLRIRKTGPKEKFVHSAQRTWKNRQSCKTYMDNSPFGQFVQQFSDRILLQNNVQCRHFVAVVVSRLISLPWMR